MSWPNGCPWVKKSTNCLTYWASGLPMDLNTTKSGCPLSQWVVQLFADTYMHEHHKLVRKAYCNQDIICNFFFFFFFHITCQEGYSNLSSPHKYIRVMLFNHKTLVRFVKKYYMISSNKINYILSNKRGLLHPSQFHSSTSFLFFIWYLSVFYSKSYKILCYLREREREREREPCLKMPKGLQRLAPNLFV